MIAITIVKSGQNIMTIDITGHSGYAEAGSDIVCSAISTLSETLALSLVKNLEIDAKIIRDESIPHLSISIPSTTKGKKLELAQVLMQSTVLGMKEVRDGYSKFIKIKEIKNV